MDHLRVFVPQSQSSYVLKSAVGNLEKVKFDLMSLEEGRSPREHQAGSSCTKDSWDSSPPNQECIPCGRCEGNWVQGAADLKTSRPPDRTEHEEVPENIFAEVPRLIVWMVIWSDSTNSSIWVMSSTGMEAILMMVKMRLRMMMRKIRPGANSLKAYFWL